MAEEFRVYKGRLELLNKARKKKATLYILIAGCQVRLTRLGGDGGKKKGEKKENNEGEGEETKIREK